MCRWEKLPLCVVTVHDQDIGMKGLSGCKLSKLLVLAASWRMEMGRWGAQSSTEGVSHSLKWLFFQEIPGQEARPSLELVPEFRTHVGNNYKPLMGHILYLVFLQLRTPAVWVNCTRVEDSILSSTGSHKSLGTKREQKYTNWQARIWISDISA